MMINQSKIFLKVWK